MGRLDSISIFRLLLCACLFLLYKASLLGATSQHSVPQAAFFQQIDAYFTIHDEQKALEQIDLRLKNCTAENKKKLLSLKIRATAQLVQNGQLQEAQLVVALKDYQKEEAPQNSLDEKLLEEIAWAIIQKGAYDESPRVRMESALASFYAQDAKGIPIIENMLSDNNLQLRLFALFLASHLRDELLQKKIIHLMQDEKSHYARLFCIETLGKMRSQQALHLLEKELTKKNLMREEIETLVIASTTIHQDVTEKDLLTLFESPHSPHRALAASLLAKNPQIASHPLLHTLKGLALCDPSFDVQLAAIQALALLNGTPSLSCQAVFSEEFKKELCSLQKSQNTKLQIAGAFLWLVLNQQQDNQDATLAEKVLEEGIFSKNSSLRLFTTSLLIHTRGKGIQLAKKTLRESQDPLVQMNLASFLIKQRQDEKQAALLLKEHLKTYSPHIDWLQEGLFPYIGPMKETHIAPVPRYPEVKNQAIRLDLWSMVATCHTEKLKEDLAHFFKESSWGITGLAAGLLIQEKEEVAIDILKKLLSSETLEIRLQAAFILAMTTQEEIALTTLIESYKSAKREFKEQILMAAGQIGSKKALPFLTEALSESSQILRIRASLAILSCLYH